MNQPYRVSFKPQSDPFYFPFLLYIYALAVGPYLVWRTLIVNWQVWYGPIVYLADLYGIVTTLLFFIIVQRKYVPIHHPVKLEDKKVDVLIPTYNEPLEVVEATVIGALHIRGIRNVLVLDDGNRPEICAMTKKLGALCYPRTTNEHAKAGNMNNGLQYSDADFVLTMDADHIPLPNFLERTVGYFDDPKVAFVQTPQTFYNTDSFLFRRPLSGSASTWSEQSMFYDCIQPAKNRWNSSFYVGTSAILRRTAIDSVGGFATGTATEDIHTSLRIHAKGWKSVFVPEVLAYGLEAASLKEFYKQRRRWAAGSLGLLFRSPDSPLRAKGLTIMQRLNYISAGLAHLQGVQKLIYFLTPVIVAFTLQGPVRISFARYSLIFLAFMLFSIFITHLYARGTYSLLYSESYSLANMMAHFGGIGGIVKVQRKFAVSQKIVVRRVKTGLKVVLLVLLLMAMAGFLRDFVLYMQGNHTGLVVAAGSFIVFNSVVLLSFLLYLQQYENREEFAPNLLQLNPQHKYAEIVLLAKAQKRVRSTDTL
jgi:cellulose synthase/poly-beta-1,6-N-acetylglucosamine synthase-like glycosyltransferase